MTDTPPSAHHAEASKISAASSLCHNPKTPGPQVSSAHSDGNDTSSAGAVAPVEPEGTPGGESTADLSGRHLEASTCSLPSLAYGVPICPPPAVTAITAAAGGPHALKSLDCIIENVGAEEAEDESLEASKRESDANVDKTASESGKMLLTSPRDFHRGYSARVSGASRDDAQLPELDELWRRASLGGGTGSTFKSRSFFTPYTLTGTSFPNQNLWKQPACQDCPHLVTSSPLEDPVQSTTDDASISKLSAVNAGYYEDPYLQYIVRRPNRRSPLINRGYYVRVAAIRKCIATFLDSVPNDIPQVQIVNLGAGLDALYFWIKDFWPDLDVVVYECDFLEVLAKKVAAFLRREPLWSRLNAEPGSRTAEQILNDLKNEAVLVINESLRLVPVDFRQPEVVEKLLLECGFNNELPTLFLSECALIYVQASYTDALIEWAARLSKAPSAIVVYEQILPHDAFGRTMVKNLELRGCPLLGILDYPTLDDQINRYLHRGWHKVSAVDMNRVYDAFIDKLEIVRIQNLELFDEVEEWRLIQAHYFILVATRRGLCEGEKDFGFLAPLSKIWDGDKALDQEIPRFTTGEIRTNPQRVHSLLTWGEGSSEATCKEGSPRFPSKSASGGATAPPLSPGPLSFLMRPEAFGITYAPSLDDSALMSATSMLMSPSGSFHHGQSEDIAKEKHEMAETGRRRSSGGRVRGRLEARAPHEGHPRLRAWSVPRHPLSMVNTRSDQ